MRDDLNRGPQHDKRRFRMPPPRAIALGLAGLLLLYLLGGWVYENFLKSEEAKIRDVIEIACRAARERMPSGITATLADDFRGPDGIDRDLAHTGFVQVLMNLYRFKVEVHVTPRTVPVKLSARDPTEATAELDAEVRGKAAPEADWESINRFIRGKHFRLSFKKTEDGWKIKGVEVSE
ncbi:MAG: hypothetical protein M5U26_23710 [Planctomycetota bacterium]|nr:hypothetical protein [Planctomycetota bacterium]